MLLFLLLTSFTGVQKKPDHVLKITGDRMTTDNLGNVYIINKETITKYDHSGVLQKTFSDKKYGPITSADASNPLRITLFYRDFGRVLFLDNMMSPIGDEMKLESLGFSLAASVASSHDNGLWIFDQQNSELIRFNRNMQIENRSGNLQQVIGQNVHACFLTEKGNWVMLSDSTNGIYLFDVYGTYSKMIPLKKLSSFQVNDDAIIYFEDPGIYSWPLIGADATFLTEPNDPTALDMRIEKNEIFVLKKDTLEIFDRPN